MKTQEKLELIEKIKIEIENMQFDIRQDWNDQETRLKQKQDIDSLKTILGHLLTLQTI